MVAISLVQFRPAHGSPGDIFAMPAPLVGADPPKATELKDGDASVSTQTGALQYSYPIQVPPGRNGMAPHLALSYSSQAPIYGGIATGWSLSIPEIREDFSQGRLRTRYGAAEALQSDPAADDRFTSSLAGGRPLVSVSEPSGPDVYKTYRAQSDSSYARYERMNPSAAFRWRVLSTDGTVMTFGQSDRTGGCVNVSDSFAPLTGMVDAFGNEVAYEYGPMVDGEVGECVVKTIRWGQNTASPPLPSFAQVTFQWVVPSQHCGGVWGGGLSTGAQRDYRTTIDHPPIVTGASRLASITATAFPPGVPGSPEHTRVITLGYDTAQEACNLPHAPVRVLTSIQESAWGTDSPRVDLPAVTLSYADRTVNLASPPATTSNAPWGLGEAGRNNLGWGYRRNDDRWPSVEATLVDMDGDGLLDRLVNSSVDAQNQIGACSARWQRNRGINPISGQLEFESTGHTVALPRLKWRGSGPTENYAAGAAHADRGAPNLEGCALNGQVTAFTNSSVAVGLCHNGASCANGSDPQNSGPFCVREGVFQFIKEADGAINHRLFVPRGQ